MEKNKVGIVGQGFVGKALKAGFEKYYTTNTYDLNGNCNCESDVPEDMITLGRNNLRNFILNEPRHVDEVIELSRKRGICAWSTARSSVKDSDVIVCDYNHVFVESIREASLPSMGLEIEDTIIVVDEAHNLPNRIRMGLERRLTNQVIRDAFNEMEEHRGLLDNHIAKMMVKNQNDEIFHNDLENAKNILKNTVQEENELRITVEDGASKIPGYIRELSSNGVEVSSVSANKPTLDDVFLEVTGYRLEGSEDITKEEEKSER